MFKRIHSDEARPAVWTELKKEFGKYFSGMNESLKQLLSRYPKPIFGLMVACILLSGVLAFTVMRVKNIEKLTIKSHPNIGTSSILQTGNTLREVLNLQSQINSILYKDSLTQLDSLRLKQAFQQLEIIHSQIKSNRK